MNLTWPIALAVLFGALLHAGWNALVKSAADKALDTALLNLIGALTGVELREAFTPRRALGTAAILAGVAALRLG